MHNYVGNLLDMVEGGVTTRNADTINTQKSHFH